MLGDVSCLSSPARGLLGNKQLCVLHAVRGAWEPWRGGGLAALKGSKGRTSLCAAGSAHSQRGCRVLLYLSLASTELTGTLMQLWTVQRSLKNLFLLSVAEVF